MATNRETRAFKAAELRVTSGADGKHTLVGYAAVFGVPSEDFGGWTEIVDSHAFDRTLSEGADVRCLVEHDPARIVGRSKSGTLKLATDNTGLRFECDLPDTSIARDLITSIERGDLDSCSFGFITRDQDWQDHPDGTMTRTLLDVDLLDCSVVAFPAYTQTSVNVRDLFESMPAEFRSHIEKHDATKEPATRALTDQCTCPCPQCIAGSCGICSADPQCMGAERNSSWRADALLRLRLAEAE